MRLPAISNSTLLLVVTAAMLAAGLMTPPTTRAATITVDSLGDPGAGGDGLCTLREAIANANLDGDTTGGDCAAGGDPDTIEFDGGLLPGTITLSGSQLVVTDNLTINGPGADRLAVDGNAMSRVFSANSTSITIHSLTIRGGSTNGSGGGIDATKSNVTLTDSIVSNNSAERDGGGISAGYSTVTLNNSTVSGNSAGEEGGGISANTLTLNSSTVSGNSATGNGGGILSGTVNLNDSAVLGNSSAGAGGGVHGSTLTLNNSTVADNSAGSAGGGIHGSTVTVSNSTVSANSALGAGGGIRGNSVVSTNSTVSGNSTAALGGGIYSLSGITLTNSIVANSSGADCSAPSIGGDHILSEDGSCGGTSGDPKLGPLADNGCVAPAGAPGSAACAHTHALLAGSPAIDAGDQAVCLAPPVNGEDQRGFPRDDGACDIGAYEADGGLASIWLPDAPAQVNHSWTFISASSGYADPVVIAGPPTYKGGDPGVARVRNVSGAGFDLRFQEWDYRDGSHVVEDIPYVVLQAGRRFLGNGTVWEVGTFGLGGTGNWQGVSFAQAFAGPPHLFLTVQTNNGGQAVSARARNVTASGFQAALFEQESLMDGHAVETIGYLAVYSPAGGGLIDLEGEQVPYLLQTLAADHRWLPVLSQRLKLEEEQSLDTETAHVDETLHVLALGNQFLSQQVTSNGGDTTALRRLPPTAQAAMEWGLIRGIDHNWQTLPFAKAYSDPVVIAKPVSNLGGEPGVIRLRNVASDMAQLRYQEWNYLDGAHVREDVFYLVSEAGQHTLGGLTVEADWVLTSKLGRAGQWEGVAFDYLFTSDPVVLSSVMTYNGGDAVTTRIRGLDLNGFQLAMDEQESKSDGHVTETLGWVAIEPGTARTSDGRAMDVFFTSVDHRLTSVPYAAATPHRHPSVIADIDSTYGADPVFLRYANPTNGQITLKLAEEQSKDAETDHLFEDVGVFVGE